jgi:cytochrome c peroxidase
MYRLTFVLVASWAAVVHGASSRVAATDLDEPITPIPSAPAAGPARVELGKRLFQDRRLSGNGHQSCGGCHDVSFNGTQRTVTPVNPDRMSRQLDTLTVFNAALSFRYSWKGSYRTLQEAVSALMASPRIMGSAPEEAATRLQLDPAMVAEFQRAYGHGPDSQSLIDALVTYLQSLVTPDSRFDLWLKGRKDALSADELAGYQLFKSVGCVACHQGVNVGGNLFQRHGIFRPLASAEPVVLRVPSLRNVAVTPPYFHDGSAPTLQDAVRKMASAQLNSDLTDAQIDSLVAFLRTLTGRYQDHPVGEP